MNEVISLGISQKIKTADIFSKLGNENSIYQRLPPWLTTRNNFLVQPIECLKKLSWERIFHSMTLYITHKSPMRDVFFVNHKLGWDME